MLKVGEIYHTANDEKLKVISIKPKSEDYAYPVCVERLSSNFIDYYTLDGRHNVSHATPNDVIFNT